MSLLLKVVLFSLKQNHCRDVDMFVTTDKYDPKTNNVHIHIDVKDLDTDQIDKIVVEIDSKDGQISVIEGSIDE